MRTMTRLSALLPLALLLLTATGAAARPVPDCLGARCGQTEVRRIDTGVQLIEARVTRSRSSMDEVERLYHVWADRSGYLIERRSERDDALRALTLRPRRGAKEDSTAVVLEPTERRGTIVTVTPPLPEPRVYRPRAPGWLPKCSGCTIEATYDSPPNHMVTMRGRGSPGHAMKRQAAAMKEKGWVQLDLEEAAGFPLAEESRQFNRRTHDFDDTCIAQASAGDQVGTFRLALVCGRQPVARRAGR